MPTCACGAPVQARGRCQHHYNVWYWAGGRALIAATRTSLEHRVWPFVDKNAPGGCWLWSRNPLSDYGRLSWNGKLTPVHVVVYRELVGPIPDGLQIDHLCRMTKCCNPAHLEAVTQRINLLRGIGASARNAVKTHCPQGHEYTPANTAITKKGSRRCMACNRIRSVASRERIRSTIHL